MRKLLVKAVAIIVNLLNLAELLIFSYNHHIRGGNAGVGSKLKTGSTKWGKDCKLHLNVTI